MNPKRFDHAVDQAQKLLAKTPAVRTAILFGSTVRGSATEDSDIDLFLDCDWQREEEVARSLYRLEGDLDVRFSPIFFRRKELHRFDSQFLESIVRQGRVLKGQMPRLSPLDLDLQPLRLVSYWTSDLDPRIRAKLLRAIDGYRTAKRVNGKRYVVEKKGFLAETGGWRVGRGAVIIPEGNIEAFDELLRRHGAKRHIIAIWCQRP
jgi:predicted nucleotidyltransferase